MGVLKNITNEYFGESLRKEDGKIVTVGKHKIIIPPGYDVKSFFDAFNRIYTMLSKKVNRESFSNGKHFILVEGGDKTGFDLCTYKYDFLKKEGYLMDGLTENMHNILIDALRVEMSEIHMVSSGFAVVAEESDFLDVLKKQGFGDNKFPVFIGNIFDECRKTFDVYISRKGVAYGESEIILVVKHTKVLIKEILSYSAVKEWFDEKLEELKKDGVEKYIK